MVNKTVVPATYRVAETQAITRLSKTTLYRLAAEGELELVKIGVRASGITRRSLIHYFESRSIPLPAGF
jgi:predicted DNA-binding transcriptional regulator AlpA